MTLYGETWYTSDLLPREVPLYYKGLVITRYKYLF